MGNISQMKVRDNLLDGRVGQLYSGSGPYDEQNYPHASDAATQVYDVTVDTAADETDYEFLVAGEPVEYTSDADATLVEIAEGLADAANDNPIVRGMFTAEDDGTDTVTLTANASRIDVDVESDDGNLTVSEETAPDDGGEIDPGLAMIDDGQGGVRLAEDGDTDDDFVGVSLLSEGEEAPLDEGPASYPYHQDVRVGRTARVFVEGGDDATRGDTVYFGTASGEEGQFFNSSGTGRVEVTDASWHKANVIELRRGL